MCGYGGENPHRFRSPTLIAGCRRLDFATVEHFHDFLTFLASVGVNRHAIRFSPERVESLVVRAVLQPIPQARLPRRGRRPAGSFSTVPQHCRFMELIVTEQYHQGYVMCSLHAARIASCRAAALCCCVCWGAKVTVQPVVDGNPIENFVQKVVHSS